MPPASTRAPLIIAILLGAASALASLCLIGRVELTFDEAYYTLWSRSLSFGYLDHPPMVAIGSEPRRRCSGARNSGCAR